ncbi:unnamed protein product [Somion occarium]|uniref:Sulfite oxidase n=1 Tax=Somion occarium TaxID=3059160 RepID=A0ABP1DI98_9APHY
MVSNLTPLKVFPSRSSSLRSDWDGEDLLNEKTNRKGRNSQWSFSRRRPSQPSLTNPVLIGRRWKEYHEALGLKSIVDFSWEMVQKEKEDMLHVLDFPYNGETKFNHIMDMEGKIMDNKYHFIRNHGGVPDIDEDAFYFDIGGLVNNPTRIYLEDLKDPEKFPQEEVTVTVQCSGTRPVEQIALYPGDGDELINAPWGQVAIGTAVYRGVQKVLKKACGGVLPGCQHLEFIGADTYFKKLEVCNYAVSVPYRKVRQNEEVLLAWEMNGQPLPRIHGRPLRLVVTGYIATGQFSARSTSYSQLASRTSSSVMASPSNKCQFRARSWLPEIGGGGNWPERVEVSPDGVPASGHVWYACKPEDMTEKHYRAWRLWKIEVPVDAEGWLEFVVRTWDSSNNTEPTYVRSLGPPCHIVRPSH